ncbi:MAG: hypothetical protein IJS94_01735 [Clostridia bacterium]|nr:hypothetical protein [Clostridia bacterium]MBQ7645966.1 hypothetical protein [Clostridia bacterium]
MLLGKRLLFSARFAEDCCGVEEVISRKMQEYVFALRKEDEYYLYDSFFCVQIFLQKISDVGAASASAPELMQPSDIRDYDVNEKILSKLTKESNGFYHDAMTICYAAESEKLQAQYCLIKFHSNREWDLDPVCILNFRLSSFILPHTVSAEKAADIPEDRIVYDTKSKERYMIDSIHMNSDICSGLSEFYELIETFMYNITLA